jgi:hypothetical protein
VFFACGRLKTNKSEFVLLVEDVPPLRSALPQVLDRNVGDDGGVVGINFGEQLVLEGRQARTLERLDGAFAGDDRHGLGDALRHLGLGARGLAFKGWLGVDFAFGVV